MENNAIKSFFFEIHSKNDERKKTLATKTISRNILEKSWEWVTISTDTSIFKADRPRNSFILCTWKINVKLKIMHKTLENLIWHHVSSSYRYFKCPWLKHLHFKWLQIANKTGQQKRIKNSVLTSSFSKKCVQLFWWPGWLNLNREKSLESTTRIQSINFSFFYRKVIARYN